MSTATGKTSWTLPPPSILTPAAGDRCESWNVGLTNNLGERPYQAPSRVPAAPNVLLRVCALNPALPKDPTHCCSWGAELVTITTLNPGMCLQQKSLGAEPKVYEDAHGRTTREVSHHMFLPHEIIGSLYATGHHDLLYSNADAATCSTSYLPDLHPNCPSEDASQVRAYWDDQDPAWVAAHPILSASWWQ